MEQRPEMVCMGWTQQQWAEAAAWFARRSGFNPLPDMRGAGLVRHSWMRTHAGADPAGRRLVEVMEWRWPSRTALERAVMMCDDPQECERLREEFDCASRAPDAVERNQTWAALLFVAALNEMCGVGRPQEMVDRLGKLMGGDDGD